MDPKAVRVILRPLISSALAMVMVSFLYGQTDQATLRGTITDSSGALMPKVQVTLTNLNTGVSRTTATTESGSYEIPYLNPGTYKLVAESSGFKTFAANEIQISARETRRFDLVMQIGSVGMEVTVDAGGSAVIATEGSQVSGGFNREAYVNSPLSRSFFPQAYMTTLANVQSAMGDFSLRFAGQSNTQVVETLDGVPSDGTVNLVQNMQDFEQLQVVAVNNSAEYSRVGVFSMVGKTGTNDFHGRVYYDLINSGLNARKFFDPRRIPYKEHQGGANVSGPIFKNKTFFYGGYSMTRIPSASFYNRNVPTEAFRRGDFSALGITLRDPITGSAFPGNIIPADRINPTSLKVQESYIPAPNQGGPALRTNNYGFLHPWPLDLMKWDSVTARVDHNFGTKNTLFGRYINRLTPYALAGSFPNVGTWTRDRHHHSIVVSDTHTFTPTLVNTARWGWIKDYFIDGSEIDGFKPVTGDAVVRDLGLQGVNPGGLSAMGFPQLIIQGVTTLRVQPGGVNLDRRDFSYADSLTWSKGRHVLKFGGELRTFRDFNGGVPEGTYGTFEFLGGFTGDAYADFLLGLPTRSQRLNPLTNRTRTAYELGLYLTDTIKLNRKLSLDYGLRWDYFSTAKYIDGLQFNWDPETGDVIVPPGVLSKISPLYPTSIITVREGNAFPSPARDNFRPRLGVAYQFSETLVMRGGYGVYTETLGNLYPRAQSTGPFQLSETFVNSVTNGAPLFSFPAPFPSGTGQVASQNVEGYPLQTNNGAIHQFNLSLEKQVASFGIRISYIGSRGRGMNYQIGTLNKPEPSLIPFTQARRPFPQFVNTIYNLNDGRANYNSGQIEINRKVGSLMLAAHYTIASNLADYLNLENPYNHYFWSRDAYTARHRSVINAMYKLPVGRGKRFLGNTNKFADLVVGGWEMTWISYFQSGQYFSPSFGSSDPSNTNTIGGLPDRIADGDLPRGERSNQRWFDASAFRLPAAGTFGNSGVNILKGPGLNVHHLSAIKRFKITERWQFVYQAQISNILNHPNFSFPYANISVPGQVAQIYQLPAGGDPREKSAGREIMMRFRIEF
jgi:carboxypeptidase family protein/TonB-dependent receptor-like protein